MARARWAQWRWAVVDSGGRLLTEGVTRRRPAHLDRLGPRGGIVELQVSESDLARLAAITQTVPLAAALEVGQRILAGQVRGRVVVDVNA